MSKLIFGCGYLGLRVARLWRKSSDNVFAVTRSHRRAAEFRAEGIEPILADVAEPDSLRALPRTQTVLYAVGFDRAAGRSMREIYVSGLSHVLDALPADTKRIVYISSTGVYAQSAGEWIDEDSPCEPVRENGRVCLEAENVLRSHPLGQRSIVLRLAGIYGRGRIPRQAALLAGEPIAAPSTGWLNLIHVEDAARIVLAVERAAHPAAMYTVSDGHPSPRQAYYAELARLIGAPPARFIEPPADSPAALRADSNKRVGNQKLLADLQIELSYPSYREGLAAIVSAGS